MEQLYGVAAKLGELAERGLIVNVSGEPWGAALWRRTPLGSIALRCQDCGVGG